MVEKQTQGNKTETAQNTEIWLRKSGPGPVTVVVGQESTPWRRWLTSALVGVAIITLITLVIMVLTGNPQQVAVAVQALHGLLDLAP